VRKPETDLTATVTALARRLDRIDTHLTQVDQLAVDVTALGRGLAELTTQVRALTAATNHRTRTDNPGPDQHQAEDAEGHDVEGQPNWLTVTDAAIATEWLTDAMAFATDVLPQLLRLELPACWPLHPQAVVEVLALQHQYNAAYTAPDPTGVSEVLSRWLPGTARRLNADTGQCSAQRAHRTGGREYQFPRLDLTTVATWWTTTHGRDPDAVEAFTLTPLT
jgi:hypothetical protein